MFIGLISRWPYGFDDWTLVGDVQIQVIVLCPVTKHSTCWGGWEGNLHPIQYSYLNSVASCHGDRIKQWLDWPLCWHIAFYQIAWDV